MTQDIESQARELLAAEYAKHGVYGGVNTRYSEIDTAAVAAIAAALRSEQVQQEAAALLAECQHADTLGAARVDDAMAERAVAAWDKFWETDSNYPMTEAEFNADPEKYNKLAMRAALEAALGQGKGS